MPIQVMLKANKKPEKHRESSATFIFL